MKTKDVLTAANVIADRYMVGLKVEDIKEVMVSTMLEYADLRERKQVNGDEQSEGNCNISHVNISLINKLIDKYEDKVKCVENLKYKGTGFHSTVPTQKDVERLNVRIYERKTFIDDLRYLLNEC